MFPKVCFHLHEVFKVVKFIETRKQNGDCQGFEEGEMRSGALLSN